jgi:cytoskeletal protein CcmA (bactofilin family)
MGFLERKAATSSSTMTNHGVTIITAGCHFNGKLFCRGVSRIGGSIDGELVAEGMVIIEEDAIINANITAQEVVIQGKVKGKLEVEKRVEIISTGEFTGELITPSLYVEDGGLLNGTTRMVAKAAESTLGKRKNKSPRKQAPAEDKRDVSKLEHKIEIAEAEVSKSPEVGIS